jgi:hypothetical protein
MRIVPCCGQIGRAASAIMGFVTRGAGLPRDIPVTLSMLDLVIFSFSYLRMIKLTA